MHNASQYAYYKTTISYCLVLKNSPDFEHFLYTQKEISYEIFNIFKNPPYAQLGFVEKKGNNSNFDT